MNYEGEYGQLFPSHWHVQERITYEFCLVTKLATNYKLYFRNNSADVQQFYCLLFLEKV